MLKRIWEHFTIADDHEEERRHVANQLLNHLTVHSRMTLDSKTLAEMGISRKQAFEAVYDLVLDERLQMRSDARGKAEHLANQEFAKLMLIEVKGPQVVEPQALEPAAVAGPDEDPLSYLPDQPITMDMTPNHEAIPADIPLLKVLPEHTVAPEEPVLWGTDITGISVPLPLNRELDWFQLDVAPTLADNGENIPADRQTLPERKREAWVTAAEELVKSAD